MCLPKDHGGLGVLDLEVMNIALLSKWLWKLFNEDGLWQQILRAKYLKKDTLCQVVKKSGDSHFWQGLMEIKHLFWSYCRIDLGNGEKTSLWEDHWIGDKYLSKTFSRLFDTSLNKKISVKTAVEMGFTNLKFRRALVGVIQEQWVQMRDMLAGVILTERPDRLIRKIINSGNFSVKSFYTAMQTSRIVPYKFLWKVKLPLKIKTFIWLVLKKSILTRDVL